MKVKLSELDALHGKEPKDVYELAKRIGFRVIAYSPPLPQKLFVGALYMSVRDDVVQNVWANEGAIIFDEIKIDFA
jgi:hypothetical protein